VRELTPGNASIEGMGVAGTTFTGASEEGQRRLLLFLSFVV
jgi:hypothetical protein